MTAICGYLIFFFVFATDIAQIQDMLDTVVINQDAMDTNVALTVSSFQAAIVDTIRQANYSVVSIVATRNVQLYMMGPDRSISVAEEQRQVGWGSGIIVSKSGYILTNRHVVEDPNVSYTVILHDGKTYRVRNIWIDSVLDIAVLALDVDTVFTDTVHEAHFISRDDSLSVGQFAFAIGNALTQWQNTVTFGVISAKNRELRMLGDNMYIWLLQTDTAINPGNSWGPLLDIYGNVIGINTAISIFGQGIGFALPVTQEFVDATIDGLESYGKIVRPFVGIVYMDITPAVQNQFGIDDTQNGVYITDIIVDSPADSAGLMRGDIIISINDMMINDDTPFLYQLYTYRPGDVLTLHILRAGTSIYRDVTIAANL